MAVATQPWVVRLPFLDTYGWFYHTKEEFDIPVNEISPWGAGNPVDPWLQVGPRGIRGYCGPVVGPNLQTLMESIQARPILSS